MLAPGKILKAEKWWNDKAPPVFALAYYLLATGANVASLGRCLLAIAAFITAFIGVAGYGHVLNDLGDIEVDRAAGKTNTMQGRKGWHSALMIAALLAMAWLPWLVLPANRWNLSFVGIQLLLLTLYAAPPLRLKTRPIPGVITDALYAYLVPMLITWTTWSRLGGPAKPQPVLLAALIPWSLCAGLKGILVHQDSDAANDAAVGLSTFVTRYGHARTFWLLTRIVLPAEIASFALMTMTLTRELPFYLVFVVLFFCWRVFQLASLGHSGRAPVASVVRRSRHSLRLPVSGRVLYRVVSRLHAGRAVFSQSGLSPPGVHAPGALQDRYRSLLPP
jgi:4-hydroxybenzoate polyprenyltransferase